MFVMERMAETGSGGHNSKILWLFMLRDKLFGTTLLKINILPINTEGKASKKQIWNQIPAETMT